MDSRVVLLQQNTFRKFTFAFLTDGGSQLVEQVCIVHTSYCTSLGKFTFAFLTDGGSQLVEQVCIVHTSYCTSLG